MFVKEGYSKLTYDFPDISIDQKKEKVLSTSPYGLVEIELKKVKQRNRKTSAY